MWSTDWPDGGGCLLAALGVQLLEVVAQCVVAIRQASRNVLDKTAIIIRLISCLLKRKILILLPRGPLVRKFKASAKPIIELVNENFI